MGRAESKHRFIRRIKVLAVAFAIGTGCLTGVTTAGAEPAGTPAPAIVSHAIAMNGKPAQPSDFTAMPYVNPDAPKGGRMIASVVGAFDSLNPLIVKGIAVQQMRGYVIESLLARGHDEPFTLYGLLARSVEIDDIRSYVTF
ncbi:ABC transporter substrate-binding protein, partial [Rhodopseudomonas sp. BR0C11]|nr:ABC transporter substrate-binding protein [Rhodopseudomonas sp. BR0C11]